MKKHILSLIIPALISTGIANAAEIYNKDGNKLDLYGNVNGIYYFSYLKTQDGDQSTLNLGLKGHTKVTDDINGYAQWEYEKVLNHSESENIPLVLRLGYVGINFGKAGSINFGRNYGIAYDVGSWTDISPVFSRDASCHDNFMFQRANNLLTYHNNNFFGLVKGWNFGIQYQGKNNNIAEVFSAGRDVLEENDRGWGISSTYDFGHGITVGTAVFQSKRTDNQNGKDIRTESIIGTHERAVAYTAGMKYQKNNVYFAALYTHSHHAHHFGRSNHGTAYGYAHSANNVELVAKYKFDFGLSPSIVFFSSKGNVKHYGNKELKKYISLGATYKFNNNLSTYFDYQVNLIKSGVFTDAANLPTHNTVAFGLVYHF